MSRTTNSEDHVSRVRRICLALPGASEKPSHGEPTFFVSKKVFAMYSNNHHHDGHIAVIVPAPPGHQEALIAASPKTYYRPPYVGVKGWVGIDLDHIDDEALASHIGDGWKMISSQGKSPTQRKPKVLTRSPDGLVSR